MNEGKVRDADKGPCRSHDGVAYQKDLDPDTATIADRMKEFDPDSSWTTP